jgi:hypothetical protein
MREPTMLVGGFNPSEKYEFVSWEYYSQYDGKIFQAMFQTTNQIQPVCPFGRNSFGIFWDALVYKMKP